MSGETGAKRRSGRCPSGQSPVLLYLRAPFKLTTTWRLRHNVSRQALVSGGKVRTREVGQAKDVERLHGVATSRQTRLGGSRLVAAGPRPWGDDPGTVSNPGDDYPDPRGRSEHRHDLEDIRHRTKTQHLTQLSCRAQANDMRRRACAAKHESQLHSINSCQGELLWHIDHGSGSEWIASHAARELSSTESIDRIDPVRGDVGNVSRNRGGGAAPRSG